MPRAVIRVTSLGGIIDRAQDVRRALDIGYRELLVEMRIIGVLGVALAKLSVIGAVTA